MIIGPKKMTIASSDTLTVALVSPGWPAETCANGIVSYTGQLTSALVQLGHHPHVLTRWTRADTPPGPGVVNLRSYRQPQTLSQRLINGLRRQWNDDTERDRRWTERVLRALDDLHDHHGLQIVEMEESFGRAARIARHGSVPVVVRLHGPHFLVGAAAGTAASHHGRARIRAEGAAIRAAHGITAPSQFVLDAVRRHYRLQLPHAVVIPTPIDPAGPGAAWTLGRSRDDTVLFVGRFDRVKGGDILVRAFGELWRRGIHARLLFAGHDSGITDDTGKCWSLADYVRDHVPDAGQSAVEALGFQTQQQLAERRREARVTVIPSRLENFATTALEAIAFGCPVVASNAGGLPEIIQHDRNGLLASPEDPADLADKLATMLQHPEHAATLGAQAADDCHARYDPQRVAQQTIDFYRDVLARHAAARRA
ncbi:MAG: glycosyltransferase family 4 protein [Phycisphaeraceae bacterium]